MSMFIINTEDGMLYVSDMIFPNVPEDRREWYVAKPMKTEHMIVNFDKYYRMFDTGLDYWKFYRVRKADGTTWWKYSEKNPNGNYDDLISYFMKGTA